MGLGLLTAMVVGCGVGAAPPADPTAPGGGAFLAATPLSFSFGNVPVGTSTTRDVTLSNTGTADAQITKVSVTGSGFSATGLPVPLTLGPGKSRTLTVGFAPPATGTFAGDVTVESDATDVLVIAPTGTGVTGGLPPAASIDSVTVNPASVVASQTVQMTATVAATGTIDKSVTWAVAAGSPGSIDAATGVYTAASTAGTYTVVATSVADPTKKGSGTVTVTATLVSPSGLRTVQGWETLFLASWENENTNTYLPLSTSGNSWDHYNLSYGIDGPTAMFEATGNTKYLDRALLYVRNVISSAKLSSSLPNSQFKDGYLAWAAWNHPTDPSIAGGEYPLYESYCWRYVTKLLRAMRQNPAVYADPAYRQTYDDVLSFAKVNVFDKWLQRGIDNIYRSRTHMAAHWAFIAVDLWTLTDDPVERAKYRTVVDNVNLHLPNYPSSLRQQIRVSSTNPAAYFWSDVWGSSAQPGQDVSHGNGVLAYIVEAHDLGVEWSDADIRAFSRTLLDLVWMPQATGYSYAMYVDGSGTGNGWFNDGLCKLGRYDATIQKRLEGHTVGRGMQLYGNGALNAKVLGGQ